MLKKYKMRTSRSLLGKYFILCAFIALIIIGLFILYDYLDNKRFGDDNSLRSIINGYLAYLFFTSFCTFLNWKFVLRSALR